MTENLLAADLDYIFDSTRSLWEEIRNNRIFITGGTAFFGCWLLESFAWANEKLDLNASALVLTRNPEAFRRKAPHLAENPALLFLTGLEQIDHAVDVLGKNDLVILHATSTYPAN